MDMTGGVGKERVGCVERVTWKRTYVRFTYVHM